MLREKSEARRLRDAARVRLASAAPRTPAPTLAPMLPLLAAVAAASMFALPQAKPLTAQPARSGAARQTARRSERLPAVPAETLLRIVRAEDERRWESNDLGALLADASAGVRRRAAIAAGRIGDEGAVAPLASMLGRDASEAVRAAAAFALGETESASGADALLTALRTGKSTEVRARATEALGKVAAALPKEQDARRLELGAAILGALAAEQRSARPDREVILLGLTATLRARPAAASAGVVPFLNSRDARVRADAANTLARLRAKDASASVRPLLSDADPVVRANAARALGAAEDAASLDALLPPATGDSDERVRVSALRALAQIKDARPAPQLLARGEALLAAYASARAGGNANPSEANELLEVASALGRVLSGSGDERALRFLRALREATEMSAPEVEVAFARVAPAQYLRERPFDALARSGRVEPSRRWQSVAALAQGLAETANISSATAGNSAVSLQADAQMHLRAMLSDAEAHVLAQPDILRAIAAFKPPDQAELMRARLASSNDPIVRATAAELLGGLKPDAASERALSAALPRALRDELNDAALSILGALAAQRTASAAAAIRTALEVPDYLVRRRAAALLAEMSGGAPTPDGAASQQTVAVRYKPADYQRALARAGRPVRALVATDKGQFTVELLAQEAPLTVDNFVQLAQRNFFDNVSFHRVVPNFVIQGGDPRGDGNGGPGYQIRCEINTVPYQRGAVGMALSGKDTGGSQWFVTHSPQPHLDGGYTVFGRVTEGMEVVDRIARGDRIRSVRIVEGKAPPQARPSNR